MPDIATSDPILDRRIRLAAALYAKQSALARADVCLSGDTAEEKNQRDRNLHEIGLLGITIQVVGTSTTFNWPGGPVVADLKAKSDALYAKASACADKPGIIQDCQALIALVPASSI